jgi:hypothetical protein
MITDHLFLGPDREVLCGLEEIRRYVEGHYDDRHLLALSPSHDRPIVEVHGSRTSLVVSLLSPASILLPKNGFYWRAS